MQYTMIMAQLSVSPVKKKAEARGIRFAAELARETGLSYPTVLKYWRDEDMQQLDVDTLMAFADFFECEPGELIERKNINTA